MLEHRAELARDVARGSGESLFDLSKLADGQAPAELGTNLHRKQARIFTVPPPSNAEVADRVLAISRPM